MIQWTHHSADLNLCIQIISSLFQNLHTNIKPATAPHPISIIPNYCSHPVCFTPGLLDCTLARHLHSKQHPLFSWLPIDCCAFSCKANNFSPPVYVGANRGNWKLVATLPCLALARENKQWHLQGDFCLASAIWNSNMLRRNLCCSIK